MAAVVGYGTWASAWLCDEASGNLADSIGSITLTASSTPTYRRSGAINGALPDHAVGFDSTFDRFGAASNATYDLDATTSLAVYVCARFETQPINGFVAHKAVTGSARWAFACNTTGFLNSILTDTVDSVSPGVTVDHVDGKFHHILFIIDRAAQFATLTSDLGDSGQADITAVGSMTNTATFALGLATGTADSFVGQIAFAAVATGITDLRANRTTAIANIRRFTGLT